MEEISYTYLLKERQQKEKIDLGIYFGVSTSFLRLKFITLLLLFTRRVKYRNLLYMSKNFKTQTTLFNIVSFAVKENILLCR